jgi:hypothetical protein
MAQADDIERLSRLAAGDLPADEAEVLRAEMQRRPELAEHFARLEALQRLSVGLPDTIDDQKAEALVQRSLSSSPPRQLGQRLLVVGSVAASCGLIWLASSKLTMPISVSPRAPTPWQVSRLRGEVSLPRVSLSDELAQSSWNELGELETDDEGVARIDDPQSHGRIFVGPDSRLWGEPGRPSLLLEGAVVLDHVGTSLESADGYHIELDGNGCALLLMEPREELVRVTEALNELPHGESMNSSTFLSKLKTPVAAVAAASVLTVFVSEGHATVTSRSRQTIEVGAGQRWQAGDLVVAEASSAPATSKPTTNAGQTNTSGAVTDAMSREELLAEVAALRAERAKLLAQKAKLEQQLKGSGVGSRLGGRNYYRLSHEELKEAADRGELRLRNPQLSDREFKIRDGVVRELGLSEQEKQSIIDIYRRSHQRIHDGLAALYTQIGGDKSMATTLDGESLLREIESKSLKEQSTAAIREIANERAGNPAAADQQPGPAITQAYRLLIQDENRVLDDLDALLSPARAEAFVNNPQSNHGDWVLLVGPPGSDGQ